MHFEAVVRAAVTGQCSSLDQRPLRFYDLAHFQGVAVCYAVVQERLDGL